MSPEVLARKHATLMGLLHRQSGGQIQPVYELQVGSLGRFLVDIAALRKAKYIVPKIIAYSHAYGARPPLPFHR